MRNEDLKKRCQEEKRDCIRVKKLILFIIFFLLPQAYVFPQVSLDGFCLYTEYNSFPGNKKLLIDKNLFAFGTSEKTVTIHRDFLSSENSPAGKLFFPYLISDLEFFGSNESSAEYLFASRKDRRAGWISFKDSNNLKIIDEIKFESYPEKILVDDFNNDGILEGLIAGNSFDGISMITPKNRELRQKKIIKNRVFSSITSLDLDYDGYADIAAVDLFSNKLIFFYNDQSENFDENREMDFPEEIKTIFPLDYNSDGFKDIAVASSRNITFLLGDSVSSFVKKKKITTKGTVSKLTPAIINADSLIDFIFFDQSEQVVKFLLSEEPENYNEVTVLKRNNIVDLFFVEKEEFNNKSGLFLLTSGGRIINISEFSRAKDFFRISFAGEPSSIAPTKNNSVSVIDNYDSSFKIFLGNESEYFKSLKSYHLTQPYSEFIFSSNEEDGSSGYFYNKNSKLIEILKLNSELEKISQNDIYANKPIREIKVKGKSRKDSIFAVVSKNNIVDKLIFEFKDFRYAAQVQDSLFDESLNAMFSLYSTDTIYSWRTDDDSLFLEAAFSDSLKEVLYSADHNDSVSVEMFKFGNKIISIIEDKYHTGCITLEDGEVEEIFIDNPAYEVIKNNESLFNKVFETDKYLYAYKNKNLFKFTFEMNALKLVNKIETEEMNSYFISQFFKSTGNYKKYLIYTTPGKSYITFRWID